MRYVLGFMYVDNEQVLLVKKYAPVWQHGALNGVGGKIEEGETPLQAMVREFKEETGCAIEEWEEFAIIAGPDFHVTCFRSMQYEISNTIGTGCESLVLMNWDKIADQKCLRTLLYLVPLGLLYTVGTMPVPRFNELPRIHDPLSFQQIPAKESFNEATKNLIDTIGQGREPSPEEMYIALQDVRAYSRAEWAMSATEEQCLELWTQNNSLYQELIQAGLREPGSQYEAPLNREIV